MFGYFRMFITVMEIDNDALEKFEKDAFEKYKHKKANLRKGTKQQDLSLFGDH